MKYMESEGSAEEVAKVVGFFRSGEDVKGVVKVRPLGAEAAEPAVQRVRVLPRAFSPRRRSRHHVRVENANKSWNAAEEQLLRRLRHDGVEFQAVAKRLGRSSKACRERMVIMKKRGQW